jgi:hypothetical protein
LCDSIGPKLFSGVGGQLDFFTVHLARKAAYPSLLNGTAKEFSRIT